MGYFVILLVSLFFASNAFNIGDDEVTSIPNFDSKLKCWRHFADYLPVSGGKKSLFYWYHEAIESPEKKPLVLWLNGGPGCSSLGGMFSENGPFVLDQDLKVTLNPYSWNKVANMLFLEQPAGVGFSYPVEAFTNDSITAADTYEALVLFLQRHNELQGRPFYITGESYGGHYIPNTAKAIIDGNAKLPSGSSDLINLIGFAVGNGYTDWKLDFDANVENGRYHALTSQDYFLAAEKACDGDYARCFWPRDDVECPEECDKAVHKATENAMDDSIDIYDIYVDVCLEKGQERLETQMSILAKERHKQIQKKRLLRQKGRRLETTISPIFATCIDNYVSRYLNLPEVQKAIHVESGKVPGGKWTDCGNVNYTFNYESELPNYKQWVAEGKLQILIYNGDTDYILSHMGNSAWIKKGLNLNISQPWKKWRGSDRQVAGYYEEYATSGHPLTFLTVKGAGHMVPKDRPVHALNMFSQFLTGGHYDQVPAADIGPLCPQ